ncbi:Hypothetical predicted protein [Paramuricea clavata]|uniref:SKI/SNO/DAC domain-containing protein n=1 Tax=Paramuricea clavata TaxID=317549 RepID=A0A6S7H365_PARCT|nr:Hypothetical predicted protein [Paramuricea clavata]
MAFPTYIKDEGDMDFGTECPIFPTNCRYKVASVTINGKSITTLLTEDEELLCFPQLVDYFLKDHVAGMPTIYAKVKRMGIIARSCNLDQVRLMRSMGAIGPVVNRCKLITMEDFKRLYEDCLLFRGPGRRKRVPSDSSTNYTPVKITIKRPYLEDNNDGDGTFTVGRKLEEEMVVNVSSPIGNHGSYFSSSSDLNKSSEGNVLAYRRNGFSSAEDKLGFPSMIYTTFPHSAPGAVTLTQSFDNRLSTTTSPKTTLITPINGEMSPTDETFDHQAKSDNQPHANDSTMMEAASLNDQRSSDDPLENGSSHQGSVPTTPNSTSSVTLTDTSKTSPSSTGVVKAAATNVIFTHVNGSSSNYTPRYSNRCNSQGGNLPVVTSSNMRQQRERMTSSDLAILPETTGVEQVKQSFV